MNRFLLLFFLVCNNAFGITTEDLVDRYGKLQVMKAIASHFKGGFTVEADGTFLTSISPDQKYINATTLNIDIRRAGLIPDDVKKIIEKNVSLEKLALEQKKEQDHQVQLKAAGLRESQMVENRRIASMREKESRIEEAMKNLEKYRQEYKKNEAELNINREKLMSQKTTKSESQITNQTVDADNYPYAGEFTSSATSSGVNPSDIKAYDALLQRGMSKSEAMEAAPIVRKMCENTGGKGCR